MWRMRTKKPKLKRTRLKKASPRGKLIVQLDNLFFRYLVAKRGRKCEVCGKEAMVGKHHILRVGTYPRLRYHEDNIVLLCWYNCHYGIHHFPAADPVSKHIEKRLQELKGENYYNNLLNINSLMQKKSLLELQGLKFYYKKWLEDNEQS